jgi:alanyl-tRNA synthetase
VNDYIMSNLPVVTHILPRNVAESKFGFTIYQGGAVPGKELRIVSLGTVDSEACGGTHGMHNHTGELGCFKIVKRESIQDGIERIVYKCGHVAIDYVQERERLLHEAASVLSVSDGELVKSVDRFFNEWKVQRKKIESLGELLVKEEAQEIIGNYPGSPLMKMVDLDEASLRKLGTKIAESEKAAAVLINKNGNVIAAAGASSGQSAKSMLERVLKELGGSGGGSDRIAQGKAQKIAVIRL